MHRQLRKVLSCPNCNNSVTVDDDFKHEMICNLCGSTMG